MSLHAPSKSDCLPALSTQAWDPGYPLTWHYAGASFALAAWQCSGRATTTSTEESPAHFEWHIQHCGWHGRRIGATSVIVDALQPGIWPRHQEYRLYDNVGRTQSATVVFLSAALLEDSLANAVGAGKDDWGRLQTHPTLHYDPNLAFQVAQLQDAHRVEPLLIQDAVHRALSAFLSRAVAASRSSPSVCVAERNKVAKAQRYIACCYHEALDVADIARQVGLSASRLSHLFRLVTGRSIWRYVGARRLQAALDLLPRHPEALTDLALSLGYASHSHFSQAFGRQFGVTPSFAQRLRS